MSSIVTDIISYLTGALAGFATGIGEGLSAMVSSIFLVTEGSTTSLSAFGAVICIFAGISLAIGLSRWVTGFITSLGARN